MSTLRHFPTPDLLVRRTLIASPASRCRAAAPPRSRPRPPPLRAPPPRWPLGQILVDGSGRTLYLFAADKGAGSTCYGSCATWWPPLLTNGAPHAGAGADAMLLGTTNRTDGTVEVKYNGHPLYYVVTDHNPGDATGQAVNNFGAAWYVLGPNGNKVGA